MSSRRRTVVLGGSVRTGRLVARAAEAQGAQAVEHTDAAAATEVLANRRLDGVVVVPGAAVHSSAALIDELLAALAGARHRAGPAPVVLVTSFAIGHGAHHAINDDAERFADRLAAEARLRHSPVPHVIVRPTWLTDDPPARATVRLTQDPETDGLIPRTDLAHVCLAALASPAAWRTTFALYEPCWSRRSAGSLARAPVILLLLSGWPGAPARAPRG